MNLSDSLTPIIEKLYTVRRELEEVKGMHLKQGDRITPKPLIIRCKECQTTQPREEEYYLHLRKKHAYAEEEASTESNKARAHYNISLDQLTTLLEEFTEVTLDET